MICTRWSPRVPSSLIPLWSEHGQPDFSFPLSLPIFKGITEKNLSKLFLVRLRDNYFFHSILYMYVYMYSLFRPDSWGAALILFPLIFALNCCSHEMVPYWEQHRPACALCLPLGTDPVAICASCTDGIQMYFYLVQMNRGNTLFSTASKAK